MNHNNKMNIAPTKGKLAILTPGMGAVATTIYAGVEAIRKGLSQPIGSYTQMGKLRLGKRSENRYKLVKDLVPLANLNDVVFGGWDVFPENAYDAAKHAQVIERDILEGTKECLQKIKPMSAVFDSNYIKNISGPNVKKYKNKMEAAEMLRQDIRDFLKNNGCDRAVIVWCASTEVYNPIEDIHMDLKKFEKAMLDNDPRISPSQIYTYAALKERVPYANGSPNVSVECPALQQLVIET